jgi:acyl-CoA synthetase (NDP forming)
VHGQQSFKTAVDIGESVDVALLMVPNPAMEDALRDLGAAGIRHAVVLAGGFAETGSEGRTMQERMVATARELGITLLGPNCLGFINFTTGAVCWTGAMRTPPLKGGISIVSQSGAVATVMKHFAHQHGVGMNVVAATGNEAMLGLAECVDYLVDDESTKVIAVFAETVRDTRLFRAAAERALAKAKPIVVLKVGRSDIATQAAQSHTGSLVGDDSVFDGVCRQLGLVRVRSIEELVFTAALLEKTGVLAEGGVAVLSSSGGMGELAADYAQLETLRLPALSNETLGAARDPSADGHTRQPAGPDGRSRQRSGALHPLHGCDAARSGRLRAGLRGRRAHGEQQRLGAACGGNAAGHRAVQAGRTRALPRGEQHGEGGVGQEPRRSGEGADSVPRLRAGHRVARVALRRGLVPDVPQCRGERAARALPGAASTAGADLPQSERETVDYLKRFGVPVVPQVLATDAKQAAAAARDMNGPVVLKIASPDIAHKTEVGGVVLNLQGDDAVEAAFRRIMDAAASAMPKARLDGVIVSPMRKGGIELFTGVRVDAQWGPVIALGLGGVWIEALQDVSLRLLPVTPADVEQMVSELRGAKLLQGFRGAPPVDVAKLADAVARIGDAALALGATLDTLEVNPLLADGARIEALDALATYNH